MEKQITHIEININILPFGQSQLIIKGKEDFEKRESQAEELHPLFGEIETTVPKKLEISFEESNFIVPPSTCYL